MRKSRNTSDDRQFSRNEWLTKTQIKGFFSRLAAKQRKQHGLLAGFSSDNEEDVECLLEDTERRGLVNEIDDEIGLKHPITFDSMTFVIIITKTSCPLSTFQCSNES